MELLYPPDQEINNILKTTDGIDHYARVYYPASVEDQHGNRRLYPVFGLTEKNKKEFIRRFVHPALYGKLLKTNKKTTMKKDKRKPIEIDEDTIVLTEAEKTSILVKILNERGMIAVDANQEERSFSKDDIISAIKKLSNKDQNDLVVSVTKDILTSRVVKMKYLEGVISDAKDQSNELLLSAKVLQEGLSASSNVVG